DVETICGQIPPNKLFCTQEVLVNEKSAELLIRVERRSLLWGVFNQINQPMCCAIRENSLAKGQFKRPDISSTTADTSGLIPPELPRLPALIVFPMAVPEASLNTPPPLLPWLRVMVLNISDRAPSL
ncbi:hypothetical protein, partial [Scytonema sp. PRP1]|uniref:hypothetical protein n=1 Tax=Scytonema sp. PRP1 TaxID=3120513 RepID=UPI002FD231D0